MINTQGAVVLGMVYNYLPFKGGYRRDEYHGHSGEHPGQAQGQNDLPEDDGRRVLT